MPLLAILVILLWQWSTVTANYRGNWTAFFCTGALQPSPPSAAIENTYIFANSKGYDGQFYRYVAYDPFMRSGLKTFVDDARLRYRRILVPLLAYLLAGGRPGLIDPAYQIVCLSFLGLGVYWSCRFALRASGSGTWGLLFLAMPAVPITVDRLVVDGALAALTAAFLLFSRFSSWKLFLVLVCASLTRETGFVLVLAYCASLVFRREFRMAGTFLLSAVPALAWYGFVQVSTTGMPLGISLIPLSAIVHVLVHPAGYPLGIHFVSVVEAADYAAIGGVLFAFGLAIVWFTRQPADPVRIAVVLFALLGIVLQRVDHWQNVFDFGRVYTPLLLCLAGISAEDRNVWLLAPIAMILPRLAIQFMPQVLGVIRWIR
jgi:hypothetical protein